MCGTFIDSCGALDSFQDLVALIELLHLHSRATRDLVRELKLFHFYLRSRSHRQVLESQENRDISLATASSPAAMIEAAMGRLCFTANHIPYVTARVVPAMK